MLTPELEIKAALELNETTERKDVALSEFRKFLATEDTLKVPSEDTAFLLRFLRVCKFNSKKAFDRICNYYANFVRYSSDVTAMGPTELLPVLRDDIQFLLPKKTEEGAYVGYYKIGNWDVDKYGVDKVFQANWLCCERFLEDEELHIGGGILIANCSKLTLQHTIQITPSHCYKVLNVFAIKGLPIRCKGVHLVFESPALRHLYKTSMYLVPRKIRKRVYFHGDDMKSLHKHIDPKILPAELGGQLGEVSNADMIKDLLEWEPLWKERQKYGYMNKEAIAKRERLRAEEENNPGPSHFPTLESL